MAWGANIPPFVFVIDTNKYAGNFEREMCAYITGQVGDCGVGEYYREKFLEDFGEDEGTEDLFEEVISIPDEHGCCRPASIWTTPKRVNIGNGRHVDEDSEEAKRSKSGWGAYESVAIFFESQPSRVLIELMKERARQFSEVPPKNDLSDYSGIEIKGFRLIKMTLAMGEINV